MKPQKRQETANKSGQKVPQKVVAFPQTAYAKNEIDAHWAFLADHKDAIRWCTEEQAWYHYNGTHWQREDDEHGAVYGLAKRSVIRLLHKAAEIENEAVRKVAATHAANMQKAAVISNILQLSKNEVSISINAFDTDDFLLNVQNGTIDLRTGQLREHRREDFISRIANVSYDASATCPEWLDFISWACEGAADFIAWKQRYFGSFLTGSTKDQKIGVDYGDGGNGKSTQYGLLQRLLGTGYVVSIEAASIMSSTKRSGAAASPDIMSLKGARLALAAEGEENQHLAAGLTKLLSGGDMIPARPLYGRPVNFRATHKLVIFTNHRPVINDNSHGMWRRIKLIPSVAEIDKDAAAGRREKREMDPILDAEMSGILNWLIAGCLEWQQNGLGRCASVDDATDAYRVEMDVVQSFLDEYLPNQSDVQNLTVKEVYASYAEWCKETNQGALKQPRFDAHLKKHKGCIVEHRTGNVRYWSGLSEIKYRQLTAKTPELVQPPAQAMLEQYVAPVSHDTPHMAPLAAPIVASPPVRVQAVSALPQPARAPLHSGIRCPMCHREQNATPTVTKQDDNVVFQCQHCNGLFDRHEATDTYFAVAPGMRVQ